MPFLEWFLEVIDCQSRFTATIREIQSIELSWITQVKFGTIQRQIHWFDGIIGFQCLEYIKELEEHPI